MLRRLSIFAIVFSLAGSAQAADAPPWKTMRALQGLEDRIAGGDVIAQAARPKVVARLAISFTALPPETWRDLRNARALVAYIFSGGDAPTIDRMISADALNKDVQGLYRGALAYGLGDDDQARTLLLPVDAKTLPAGLAGHVALVQASLLEPTDKAKATALYDLVRLLEPGTLVEESALRRQMAIAGDQRDFERVAFLERRYQAAFSRSVYIESFRQLVAQLAFHVAAENTASANQSLERLVAFYGRDEKRRVYLAVARREAVAGHVVSAIFAASEATKLCEKGGRDEARARLYWGAVALVGDSYDKASLTLSGVAVDRLDERDRALRLAALDMATAMRAVALGAPSADPTTTSATVSRGQLALDEADVAMKGVKP